MDELEELNLGPNWQMKLKKEIKISVLDIDVGDDTINSKLKLQMELVWPPWNFMVTQIISKNLQLD